MTIHIYPKNALASPTLRHDRADARRRCRSGSARRLDRPPNTNFGLPNTESGSIPFGYFLPVGTAATLMSAQLIATPRVELICFFNLTAGKSASAIFDADVSIAGATAPKYALVRRAEGLKCFPRQRGAVTVKRSASPIIRSTQGSTRETRKDQLLYYIVRRCSRLLPESAPKRRP